MNEKVYCDVCYTPTRMTDTINIQFNDQTVCVCNKCAKNFENLKSPETCQAAERYLEKQSDYSTPLGAQYLKSCLSNHQSSLADRTQPLKQSKPTTSKASKQDETKPPKSNEKKAVKAEQKKPDSDIKKDTLPKYKDPGSATFIIVFATLCLMASIILIVASFTEKQNNETFLFAGIGGLLTGVLLFIISTITCDLHRVEYNTMLLIKENQKYQEQIIELLKEKK